MSSKILNKKLLTPSASSPDHVLFRKNDLVPPPSMDHDDNNNNKTERLGRDTLYEPVLIFSPVMTSRRILAQEEENNKKKRLITADDVDELTKQLDFMLLGGPTTEEETKQAETEKEVETKATTIAASIMTTLKQAVFPTTVKSVSFDFDEKVGRYEDTIQSTKSHEQVTVKRCSRLA